MVSLAEGNHEVVLHCAPMANLELAKNQTPDGSLKYSSGILQHRYSPKSSKVSTLRYHVCDIILYIYIYYIIYMCACALVPVCVIYYITTDSVRIIRIKVLSMLHGAAKRIAKFLAGTWM